MRILFVSAAGYGNIGDDTYPLVFKSYFGKEHQLFFANSDPSKIPARLDLIVFGGGGLLFDSGAHLSYMKRYVERAQRLRIPYGFSSCGLQCRRDYKNWTWQFDKYAKAWIPIVQEAAFSSFRDETTYNYFQPCVKGKSYWFPDLCYLYQPLKKTKQPKHTLVIPAAKCKLKMDEFRAAFADWTQKSNLPVVAADFGGPGDELYIELEGFRKVYGCKTYSSDQIQPEEAYRLVTEADCVFTGRYHGMVFARSVGVHFWKAPQSQYKLEVENYQRPIADAIGHIELLQEYIK